MKQKLQFLTTVVATLLFGAIANAQCPAGQGELTVDVTTDTWGYEAYWEVTPTGDACGTNTINFFGNAAVVGCGGEAGQVAAVGDDANEYASGVTTTENLGCFALGTCMDIHMVDDWGDDGTVLDVMVNGIVLYTFNASGTYNFCVTAQPALDLRVDAASIGTPYTMVPMAQVVPMSFDATIFNFGTSSVTNANVAATVNDGATDVATANGTAVATLVTATASTGALTPGYTAVSATTHTITFVSSMTEVDENTSNDTMMVSIAYNDSVLARDNNIITGALGIGAGSGQNAVLGMQYASPVGDMLTSITAVHNAPTPGDTTMFSIWDMAAGAPNASIASTMEYIFTAADSINAPLVLTMALPAPLAVTAGMEFVAMVHEYSANVSIATDNTSNYVLTTNWVNWTGNPNGPGFSNGEAFAFGFNYLIRPNFASGASIGENALNTATVYPNPTKGAVKVSLSEAVNNATVTVYSVAGNVVSSAVVSGTQFEISLEGLTSGLYIMELSNGSEKGVYRIVKD
ncbi:MAG: T9SS type A sorting domain-containing protein [Fluviicola sp.]|nr:T9SS type A sorting domain-containing protein [Fluviicola sp.]